MNGGAREKCCLVALLCLFFAAWHLPQSLPIKHEFEQKIRVKLTSLTLFCYTETNLTTIMNLLSLEL